MIHLSVPVLAHSTSVCPTSPNHFTHTSILCLSSQAVTPSAQHNFSPQDKQILSSIYLDVLRTTQQAHTLFSTDPSRALSLLAELNRQLSLAIQ
jgi:hypothetical protein